MPFKSGFAEINIHFHFLVFFFFFHFITFIHHVIEQLCMYHLNIKTITSRLVSDRPISQHCTCRLFCQGQEYPKRSFSCTLSLPPVPQGRIKEGGESEGQGTGCRLGSATQGMAGPSQPLPPGSVDHLLVLPEATARVSASKKFLCTHRHVPVSVICINVLTKEISLFFRCANFSLALLAWILPQGPVCLHPRGVYCILVSACVPTLSACILRCLPASPRCLPASPRCPLRPRSVRLRPRGVRLRPRGVCLRPRCLPASPRCLPASLVSTCIPAAPT